MRVITILISLLGLLGCAGPTTPLGAVASLLPTPKQDFWSYFRERFWVRSGPSVTFSPARQVLHAPKPLAIQIHDPEGIAPGYRLVLRYNGAEVTSAFLIQAKLTQSADHRDITYTVPLVYLAAIQTHHIEVEYESSSGRKAFASLLPPSCYAFGDARLMNTEGFTPPSDLVRKIASVSEENGFNPAFTAALIAQESGFNPRTVSIARALGLTQITPHADEELVSSSRDWPRYPGINDLTFPALKTLVSEGRLNEQNDWRLDPGRSIQGGLAYLELLSDHWDSEDNQRRIEQLYPRPADATTRLMLASYHSGYARVQASLRRNGEQWLESDELSAARRYVNRIFSFCDQFSEDP